MKTVHASTEGDLRKFQDLERDRAGRKTVAFVGMAPKTRVRAPFDVAEIEIWTLARSWRDTKIKNNKITDEKWVKRISRHFEIHPEAFCYLDNKPNELHYKWLKQDHPFVVYMDDDYPQYPASRRYPIERAVATYGRHFTSTMSYMFPIAEFDGFDRIELYGFEMGLTGEYQYQMPEVSYHIGWFRALHGYDSVVIPPESKILRAPLYAYEEMYNPILTSLEQRIHVQDIALRNEEKEAALYEGGAQTLSKLVEAFPGIEYSDKFQELKKEVYDGLEKHTILGNSIVGALHEDKVWKDAIYYMLPPSYKSKPEVDLTKSVVPWEGVDLPWKEAGNEPEQQKES